MGREVRMVPEGWRHPKNDGVFEPLLPKQMDEVIGERERSLFQMYEDTSEGTPISPPMPTREALARYLTDSRASAFGGMTATYDEWLAMIGEGYAVSAVIVGGVMRSGVEDSVREGRTET